MYVIERLTSAQILFAETQRMEWKEMQRPVGNKDQMADRWRNPQRRDELGVKPGQVLDLVVRDGRLQVEIAPVEMRLERRRNGPVRRPRG